MAFKQGDPMWVDLGSDQLEESKKFYSELFGWEFTDTGADFGYYNIITLNGQRIGGAMNSLFGPDGPREKAETSNAWSVYLKVDDMEQSIEAVKDAGAPVRFATNTADESKATAGLCDASSFLPEGVPSFWRPYFLVEDADAAIERIKELGGSVIDGSMDSPYGRIATVAGPDATAFQIVNVPQDS